MNFLSRYCVIISILLIALSFSCLATDEIISIESLTFEKYVDDNGETNDDLLSAEIKFSAEKEIEQFSLLLMSENLTQLDNNSASKVIYIDQFASTEDGAYEFVVEKSRIASATNQTDIEGTLLYAKMGGMGVDKATLMTVVYNTPRTDIVYGDITGDMSINIADAIFMAQALASNSIILTDEQKAAADVNGDGAVNISDLIFLMQHLASPNITLGPKQ